MKQERLLTLGELARDIGISQSTLRRYVDEGLVPSVILPSGYRRFTREMAEEIKAKMYEGRSNTRPASQPE